MKILTVNKYYYIRGGSDRVYFNTNSLLKQHGYDVIHFSMNFFENFKTIEDQYFARNKDFAIQNIFKRFLNFPSFFYNYNAGKQLKKLILKERPNLAHLHIFYGSLTSSILQVLKNYSIPIVVTVHDYKFICPNYLLLNGRDEICEKCKGHNYYQTILNKCVKKNYLFSALFALEAYYRDKYFPIEKMFNRIIFVSKFSKNLHLLYKPELASISKHLYNFDPTLTSKIPSYLKGTYFLYLGRLSKEKGIITLVKAFSQLNEIKLKIAGTGPELQNLQNMALENVEFLGFKEGEELTQIIHNASFVVVPSECYEHNPMAIVEAYAAGKPVIASNIGGIPEIVVENKTGFLFSLGNLQQLKSILKEANYINEEQYHYMSEEAFTYANEQFHPEKHFHKLMKIYNEVLNETKN